MSSPELTELEHFFYGSATLGERGQIVVPSDARKDCEMSPGDKILVFRHPLHPHMLILAKIGEMQELLTQMARALEQMTARMQDTTNPNEP